MAKGFDVIHAKSAVKSHNKFDISQTHLTTMDFGEIVPLLAEELVPGDKFNVKGSYFSRMAPLAKPTYGKFSFRTMAAFVPYYQVADDAEAWLAGNQTWEGSYTSLRSTTMLELAKYFDFISLNCGAAVSADERAELGIPTGYNTVTTDADRGVVIWTNSNDSAATPYEIQYDWLYTTSSNTVNFKVFRGVGKYYLKVMNALGYALPQNVDMRTGSTWYTTIGGTALNAMPLLCFAKAYNDYMSQSQRYNDSILTNFLKSVKEDKGTSGYNNGSHRILYDGIDKILRAIILQYENDYFISAWQSPNSPISQVRSIANAYVPAGNGSSDVALTNSQYNTNFATTGLGTISQRTLDFLKSFDDWVRRNNYSGSRAVQSVYSRFGIKTADYKSNYAHVISTDIVPVQVGDITSQADTDGAILGEYAGKGIMAGDKGFSFDSNDYGMLFVLGWYTVKPMDSYGFDRVVLKNTPLDFYNPEFDGLGANAISYGELFCNPIASADTYQDNSVYGFTERYNEYRFGRDKITGDFRDYHKNGDMNTWHTGRLLGDLRKTGRMVAQNSVMNAMPQSESEYNRMFSITDDSVNHFYLTADFQISAVRPMLSLNQVPCLGEGDTTVPRNGNVIN